MIIRKRQQTTTDTILSQIRTCLEGATEQPGLVKASVYQTEGYLRGVQGLAWELSAEARPLPENVAASFLHDVRTRGVALRGRVKAKAQACLEAFQAGLGVGFPEAKAKLFFSALPKLWTRWLAEFPVAGDPFLVSHQAGRDAGKILNREYHEGLSGNLAPFLMDKRLHLDGVRGFLQMRGWLLGTIEHLKNDPDPAPRERAGILNANFSSILLRAQHNAGPGYAAEVAGKLSSMMRDLDLAVRALAATEPEASQYLHNNRATIITRALHSGDLDYGAHVSESLPGLLKELDRALVKPVANKRTMVYRALTNGRLDRLRREN